MEHIKQQHKAIKCLCRLTLISSWMFRRVVWWQVPTSPCSWYRKQQIWNYLSESPHQAKFRDGYWFYNESGYVRWFEGMREGLCLSRFKLYRKDWETHEKFDEIYYIYKINVNVLKVFLTDKWKIITVFLNEQ
jgi:hypothetical protein